MKQTLIAGTLSVAALVACSGAWCDQPLPGTKVLTEKRPLDVVMVEGIGRYAQNAIKKARLERPSRWHVDFTSRAAHEQSLVPYRERFAKAIGVVDPRVPASGIEFIASTEQPSLVAEMDAYRVHAVRWQVLEGMTAEGLLLEPKKKPIARVVALPDANWTPEMISALAACPTHFAADLAANSCEVLVPTLINRDHQFSRNLTVGRTTNLTHREFIYRQAFELGRHVIGYEVQKVLAAVDQFEKRNASDDELPLVVAGVSEGGLLAFYAAALDSRIDAAVISGYVDQREMIWREPIYRNVWNLLTEFGDAEIAGMIAPRRLYVETSPAIPELAGPPEAGRNVAAPGSISRPNLESVREELRRAAPSWQKTSAWSSTLGPIRLGETESGSSTVGPLSPQTIREFLVSFTGDESLEVKAPSIASDARSGFSAEDRQRQQVAEMTRYTQRLLRHCHRERERRFAQLDRSSIETFEETATAMREQVYTELIGKVPEPTIDPNPRSRKVMEEAEFTGYEVVLDVYPDIIAAGILLMPTDLGPDERRPVVVCQHGLEGTPMDTILGPGTKGYRAYKSFSVELVKRGFIVYAPQNPYRGGDAFRTLQRQSNPLGRSLFSYIIPQHLVTLRWLATLPNVDADRIGFYGLSYGGKTAVRVPPMLPPRENEPGYCLSICSADFNDWVAKNASVNAKFSYIWTGEYEIFEWNMGHVANYAELAMLMTPRPFMVERGHDDGVGIDEWVAWEYAKVRRHYNKLGLEKQTEIEFFDGPHTINGKGTYRFLHRHLRWPR